MGVRQRSFIVCAMLLFNGALFAQKSADTSDALGRGFLAPPDSAKPRTWWHWTNGNVTEEGITKDLEWMKRAGIGGFQLVDVAAGGGQTVEKKINFGTPEWYHAVRHSAEEAKRLDLEMSIFSSPGWSEAGGPWVPPAQAMKRLVWSETELTGPAKFHQQLPQPPSNEGPVRDLLTGPPGTSTPHFYADSAVIAYRTPADDVSMSSLHPKVTTNEGPIDGAALMDDSLNTSIVVHTPHDEGPAWVQFEFAQPYTARALTLGSHNRIPVGRVLASEDGATFHTIATMPGPQGYHGAPVRTFAFPAVTAKFFRIELDGAGLLPAAVIHGGPVVPASEYALTEAVLSSAARVNRWEDKGAFGSLMDVYEVVPTPEAPPQAEIARGDIIDLSSKMDKDGTLHWEVPPGRWTVLRMGYALTGAKNRPATPAGLGYEVDKLNGDYVRSYFNGYMAPIQKQLGDLTGTTLQYMTMDSWEAGMQNWTDDMPSEFRRRRGYDPTPFLPVLAGHVVESSEVSDRFLWDFRRTLADMFVDSFYGVMESELQKRGMRSYAEASGVALEIPEDTLLNKGKVDIPMAEFWVHALHPESMYFVDVRGAASAAHVYGKPIVATESFTGGGYESPYTLKKVADYWFAQGVNRLVFHTSAQQPLDTKPGNTMVGTHLNRNITWAEQAAAFMTYIARVSYMLQQGRPVADIAYLLPEGAPSTMPFWGAGLQPAPPPGHDYDYLNTDVLLHSAKAGVSGTLDLHSGMSYRVLVLPPTTDMTPEVLRKLHALVAAGVTVVGPRPQRSPSLQRWPDADTEVQRLAEDLWADTDGVTKTQHGLGKGTVYWGLPLDDVLARLKVRKDFDADVLAVDRKPAAAPVWVHRRSADADIYFIANQTDGAVQMNAHFRANGKNVEIWRPMDGGQEEATYTTDDNFTNVPLHFAERESVFVVFRHDVAVPLRPAVITAKSKPFVLTGTWKLSFPSGLGAPASVSIGSLKSWTESADAGVKYFSGTATYTKTFNAPLALSRSGKHVLLDLGTVRDIAEVTLNGTPLGAVWAPPYRVDVTKALKRGTNRLEITVTNEWTNRIVGDRLLPQDKRVLSPTPPSFRPLELTPSGLIGDVSLRVSESATPGKSEASATTHHK